MGHGTWNYTSFARYSAAVGRTLDKTGAIAGDHSAQEIYKNRSLSKLLDPRGVVRECCDSDDHPNTLPVILALDVTGSMGQAAVEFASKLNVIMTQLYKEVQDVEFLIMGLGDVMYDKAPVQASQFESDIRIAEQLDEIYFEHGGGGNAFESYTAAWYFGARHTRLDCWKRGQKGLIITIGDELINPYLPVQGRQCNFNLVMGDANQDNINTDELYEEVRDKYELYHLVADHDVLSHTRANDNVRSFSDVIGPQHVQVVNIESLADTIIGIIKDFDKTRAAKTAKAGWIAADKPDTISW